LPSGAMHHLQMCQEHSCKPSTCTVCCCYGRACNVYKFIATAQQDLCHTHLSLRECVTTIMIATLVLLHCHHRKACLPAAACLPSLSAVQIYMNACCDGWAKPIQHMQALLCVFLGCLSVCFSCGFFVFSVDCFCVLSIQQSGGCAHRQQQLHRQSSPRKATPQHTTLLGTQTPYHCCWTPPKSPQELQSGLWSMG